MLTVSIVHVQQANLSAQEAAHAWREVQGQLKDVTTWVSPANFRGPCGDPELHVCREDALLWYTQFFQVCTDCRVDYLAAHVYWCDTNTAMAYLQQLWDRFHIKLWLTEFACPDAHTVSDQLTFMKVFLPRLEAAPYVARYSWFATRVEAGRWIPQAASLLQQNSSTLTDLGRFYMSF
ncbi:hypothetical protein BaRGS_00022908 [Batillaria attramentaria]|uniref:Asl1-like glycosyl hydrolase catalytic domain-containing protein n=1 Tax=Batillaria attramentaria TaxID=370345 RepID=A0ABD0KFV3_9CAEN